MILLYRVERHGELHIETADALEAYGNALLKNAISQSAVLGGEAAKEKAVAADPTGESHVPLLFYTNLIWHWHSVLELHQGHLSYLFPK